MAQNTARRITNREITGAVRNREAFHANSTSGRGTVGLLHVGSYGQLPVAWADLLSLHTRTVGVAYIVHSYATPIAWVLTDGTAVVPSVKYSVTTSKAQGYVRAGLRNVHTQEELHKG